ncbi:hypothetical protein AMC83_CH04152 [Rhizobium phaseoli]|uniref:DUF4231 domain-containing protein n=1 Tax=Rhizobium phaseoli TaxID=396 RepID=UPI0007E99A5D|nr:DUF4231 domain-containing protein [Rhizobium phaseoli]ANL74069.1 hypothetical protein AMC83_CH04152 [Rhizobium phaseoli]
MKYPTLFETADVASNTSQRRFLWLIRIEYALLLTASIFSLGLFRTREYYVAYAIVFAISMAVMAYRSTRKPERIWYQARALAESVKTLTWRFAMRAEPFDDEKSSDARRDFRHLLKDVLKANEILSEVFSGEYVAGEQLPNEVQTIREFSLEQRKEYYLKNRIAEQRAWYVTKAKANRKSASVWFWVSLLSYSAGFMFIITRVVDPSAIGWPTEPLIVFATAIVGWTQIKKFNELAAAYSLTAQEIGLTEILISDAKSNRAFSSAVNEAELAFSREHTQWGARQHQGG